ncbi:hypothetical protein NSQ54_16800 [Alkalihalobacillus sp. FSL W8-0930]
MKNMINKHFNFLLKNPIIFSFIIAAGGGYFYFCGHLLITTYLLGNNFRFMDFLINPLPLPYGHIIAVGGFILFLLITFLCLATYSVYQLEKSNFEKPFFLVITILALSFLLTNAYTITTDLNYLGVALGILGLIFFFMILTVFYVVNNLLIGVSAWLYSSILYTLAITYTRITTPELNLYFFSSAIIIYWLLILIVHFLNKTNKNSYANLIVALPINIIGAMLVVAFINFTTQITSIILICLFTIILSFLLNIITKDLNLRISKVFVETDGLLAKPKTYVLICGLLVLLLPILVILSGNFASNITNQPVSTIKIDGSVTEGRYIGTNNNIHYFIRDQTIIRTQKSIEIE